jgi:hypothetical protein
MPDPNRLLVVSHPILANISRDEIERAVPESQRAGGWDLVEIVPLRAALGKLHEIDWSAANEAQDRWFAERLQREIKDRCRLAYFGFAPIPLALHLGYRIERGIKVDVYQRHHILEDWEWPLDRPLSTQSLLRPMNFPDHGSTDPGPVVIRISTSHRIAPAETAEVVPKSLAEVDVALSDPGEDALATRGALAEVVTAFNSALARLKRLFPNITTVHLFAAIPVGLAFRLGTQINPTIYPKVVTYQYWAKGLPRYRRAIVLTEDGGAVSSGAAPGIPAHSVDSCEIDGSSFEGIRASELAGQVLRGPEYDWRKLKAEKLHGIIVRAYGAEQSARLILQKSGIDVARINFRQSPYEFWMEALNVAAAAGHFSTILRQIAQDRAVAAYLSEIHELASQPHEA